MEVWDDWSDGAPEWTLSKWDDEVWINRDNAERSLVDHAVKVLEKREKHRNETIAAQTKVRTEYDALVAAGLDPKDFGRYVSSTPAEPFDWDDPKDTTLTDEAIGYRIAEFETAD